MDTNKRLTSAVDAVEEEIEEMHKKRRLQSHEGSIYSKYILQLQNLLPSWWLLWANDWSYLLKSIDSSSSDDEVSDLVSLCQWFLSTDAPETYKNGANQALKHFFPGTSLDTQMSIDHQSSLERLLDSKHELVIQQAYCAIAFLCWCHSCNYFKSLSFSEGVVNKLFDLAGQDSRELHALDARRVICSIAYVDESVKKKIIMKSQDDYDDYSAKWPFLYGDAEKEEHTCMIVACIVGGEKDDATWDKISVLIPPIVGMLRKAQVADDIPVMVAAAYAISSAAEWATHEQIDMLFDMGCLEVLCNNLCIGSPHLTCHSLDGIDHILYAGDEQGLKKYVDWIENDKNSPGWVAFGDVYDRFLRLKLPGYLSEIESSIQYRAYSIASMYGGCDWISSITCSVYGSFHC